MRKGDLGSLDRLSLYLWGALILVIVLAMFWYFTVYANAQASGFTQLLVTDRQITPNGDLSLRLLNTASQEVMIMRIDAGLGRTLPRLRVPQGAATDWLEVTHTGKTGKAGERYDLGVTLYYALLRSGIPDQVSNGTVHGTFTDEKPI